MEIGSVEDTWLTTTGPPANGLTSANPAMSTPSATLDDFYSEAEPYVRLFDTFAEKHQLVGRAQADHLCYKCDSREVFEYTRGLFEAGDGYIFQSIIAKRRIAVIRLPRPIQTALGPEAGQVADQPLRSHRGLSDRYNV